MSAVLSAGSAYGQAKTAPASPTPPAATAPAAPGGTAAPAAQPGVPRSAPPAPAAPRTEPDRGTGEDEAELEASSGPFKLPLLRDGALLERAVGTMRRDERHGTWVYRLRDDLDTAEDREISLLPCQTLEDMIGHVRGKLEAQWFELSGMVLLYRGQNYLLAAMATPLSAEPPRPVLSAPVPPGGDPAAFLAPAAPIRWKLPPSPTVAVMAPDLARRTSRPAPARVAAPPPASATAVAAAPAPPAGAAAPSAPPAPPAPPPAAAVDPETFAADIERQLEARIAVVPRSSDAAQPASPFSPKPAGPALSGDESRVLLPAVVRLHDRRGSVSRDPVTGTWIFVFQSDRAEVGERAVELLPCKVLERLERLVRQSEAPPPLLVSGQLTAYRGRNYLLPSSFRYADTGRWVYP